MEYAVLTSNGGKPSMTRQPAEHPLPPPRVQQRYTGSRTIVRDFVATLQRRTQGELVVRCVRLGPRQLRRWFTCLPEKFGENERRFLDMVLEASPTAREAYSLLQEF